MEKTKPKITEVMKKNISVKCPHCGWSNRVLKSERTLACRKCHQFIDLDKEYEVDKYY